MISTACRAFSNQIDSIQELLVDVFVRADVCKLRKASQRAGVVRPQREAFVGRVFEDAYDGAFVCMGIARVAVTDKKLGKKIERWQVKASRYVTERLQVVEVRIRATASKRAMCRPPLPIASTPADAPATWPPEAWAVVAREPARRAPPEAMEHAGKGLQEPPQHAPRRHYRPSRGERRRSLPV